MRTSEALARAADLIETKGWVQGNYGMLADQDVPKCITGAIACALDLEPAGRVDHTVGGPIYAYGEIEFSPAYRAVFRYLRPELEREQATHLWQWNDKSTTTKERVIEVLRAAALIEAAAEQEKVSA